MYVHAVTVDKAIAKDQIRAFGYPWHGSSVSLYLCLCLYPPILPHILSAAMHYCSFEIYLLAHLQDSYGLQPPIASAGQEL